MADIQWNDGVLQAMLKSPDGLVGKFIATKTLQVYNGAVEACPVDTGRLRSSIRWAIKSDASNGVYGLVSTDVEYASYVEDGTKFMEPRHFLLDALEALN